MRIIAGEFKGRQIAAPNWPGLRPTSDKLRETLFNVVGPTVEGARVLDGYAGTGALGLEALSRGAAHATFIERDRRAVALIRMNLERLGLARPTRPLGARGARRREALAAAHAAPDRDHGGRYAIIHGSMRRVGRLLGSRAFNLILLDPPYDDPDLERVLAAAGGHLASGGLLILERARRREPPDAAGPLGRIRSVRSGDSALDLYRHAG